MADKLHFELVSPERLLMSAEVHMVVVPGTEGDFGVLAGHAPFMSTVRTGVISVHSEEAGPPTRIFIDGGFAEVNDTGLTILAEEATPVSDFEAADIQRKLGEAREDVKLAKTDAERAIAEKAVARLEAIQSVLVH